MSVIRVNKTKDYTIMSNYHLKEKDMSLKAKGLLSQMLSLPDNWDYTIKGLAAINKETESTIKSILEELKNFHYLVVTKKMPNETSSGRIEYIYDIYEKPFNKKQEGKKQEVEKQGVVFQGVEKQEVVFLGQLNTNNKILNNKILNNKSTNNIKAKNFIPPTLKDIEEYCKLRNNNVNAKTFFDYYEAGNWIDAKGNKVKNWKQKIITWEKHQEPIKKSGWDYIDEQVNDIYDEWKEEKCKEKK